ncbi:hypothetical protein GF356_00990, partial [candidate division GN15 bacterium]|nr:hypothetical protein [candidate division GN15 bacterium]
MNSTPRALMLFAFLISVAASVSAQDIDWTRIYGGPIEDRAVTIEAVPGGGYYLLGNVRTDDGFLHMRLYRLNADGDSLWAVTLGHVASDLAVTADGGCVVLGQAGDVPGSMHILLVEIAANGHVVDSVGVYAPLDEWAHDIERTLDGGFVLCGERVYPEGVDIWVVRLDEDYNTLWEYRGGGDWVDGAVAVKPLLDGGVVLGGYQGLHDDTAMPYIVRLDEQGEEVWSRMYMCDSVYVRTFTVAANGDLVLGGIYSRGPYYPFKHPWMLRCASNGDSLWTGTYDYDIAGFDRLYPLSDGSIFAYGHQGEYLYASSLAIQVGLDGTNLWAHNQKIDGYLTWGAACDVSSMQVDSSFVACGTFGYWDIHPDSMDMFVMKMQHNDYQLTGPRVRVLPEPVPFAYAYLVTDTVGVDIFVGEF